MNHMMRKFRCIPLQILALAVIFSLPPAKPAAAQDYFSLDEGPDNYQAEYQNIRSVNGKLYAYIVLLFNENPHFVNIIQKSSIPLKVMAVEGFHIREYKNYLTAIHEYNLKGLVKTLLDIYLEPEKFEPPALERIEKTLAGRNIILKFSRDKNHSTKKIVLDYCIYGKKIAINVTHPLLPLKEKIYNIQPYIYYDEFSTSNSTFYYDMIYINSEEVQNDYIIARRIISGLDVKSMFFVGSRVTDDIKYCLTRAFKDGKNIRAKIWEMFVIHELTHKYINNRYNSFDQVGGEELSLASTIYSNPHLGLSVLYSYLNYNTINPHRIAAFNLVKFISAKTGNPKLIDEPGAMKLLEESKLKAYSREYFESIIKKLD